MCSQCHRTRRRRAAAIALVPMITFGQPVATGLLTHWRDADRPVTGATLTASGSAMAADAQASNDPAPPVKYTCPMHPHYIADEMGTCPICGMDLVKLASGPAGTGGAQAESRTIVTVAPETIQNMGVRLGKVELSRFGREVRSTGMVRENERLQTDVTARVEGWIEDLQITAVGDEVRKGDVLFKLYSPQLIISQNDFLRSRGTGDLAERGEGQLRSFGVQARALDEIRTSARPIEHVPFYAEQDGTVAQLNVRSGSYVTRGMLLARVQDYSEVWLQVGVSEKDLGFITRDTPAKITFPSLQGREVAARVDYIYPTVDDKTRTGQVRLVVPNADGTIRPGSYADVVFAVGQKSRLAIPSEAILRSGAGRYVVVSLGQGRFEPRLVDTGLASDGRTEILKGLIADEDVVVSGQFLLDSESALRESFRKLQRLQLPLTLLKPSDAELAMIDHLVDASLYVHEALVDGYEVAPAQLDAAISIRDLLWPRYKDTQLSFVLNDAVAALTALKAARTEGETQAGLARLNEALRAWVLKGAPEHYRGKKLAVFRDTSNDRLWYQLSDKALNPFGRGASEPVPLPQPTADGARSAAADPVTPPAAAKTGVHDGH